MRNAIIDYFLRLHGEDYAFFIDLCGRMPAELIWHDVPDGVPVANILCHVAEMERFWIDSGLCGLEFDRDRQNEFTRRGDLSPEELARRLSDRRDLTRSRIDGLTAEQWETQRQFHGDTFTGAGILAWHLHHLGLHRGHVQVHERWLLKER